MADSRRFTAEGMRMTAFELARSGDVRAWNAWRQETDLLGDHERTRINLSISSLSGANLAGFNLTNVSFYRAELSRSNLTGCDCAHADFNQAKLIGADLSRTNLTRARLSRAYLREAKLDYSDLRRADLRRASLKSASLVGARIEGLDLSSTRGLTQEQLEDARGDSRTRLPSHLSHPLSWDQFETDREVEDDDVEDLRIIPSSVEVAVIGDQLQLTRRPGDAYFAATSDTSALKQEILADITLVAARCGNIPLLSRALTSYGDELGKEDFDIIIVGVRGLRVQAVFTAITDDQSEERAELLNEVTGSIRAILIQHFLFVSQSHRWKQFLEEAALAPYRDEDKATARGVAEEVTTILQENAPACDPRVPSAVEAVTRELAVTDDAQRLATFNAIASVENVFRGVITWVVKEAKRFLGDAWTNFRDKLSSIVGKGMATLVVTLFSTRAALFLAEAYPERFAWLVQVIELLRSVHIPV